MDWKVLRDENELEEIVKKSEARPQVIFKHSTRCSISRTTLDRLERNWKEEFPNTKYYFLDLLSYREISNAIVARLEVEHQSPQVLIVRNGKSVFDRSHFEIEYEQIKAALKN